MSKKTSYNEKIENIIMERVYKLEEENEKLRFQLTAIQAKLEVYERIANLTDKDRSIGFESPIIKEGD